MKIDLDTEMKMLRLLPEMHKTTDEQFRKGIASQLFTVIGDIRDYFMWTVVNCKTSEEAIEILGRFQRYSKYFGDIGDKFYEGFFFTLDQTLSLKFGITMFHGEDILYVDFEESMKRTLKYIEKL